MKIRELKIVQIIEGWVKRILGIKTPYEKNRIAVCNICDINIDGICNKELGGCGCSVKAKVKCKGCKCPLNRW
jgi:hypothetical protein